MSLGVHVIADFYNASNLDNVSTINECITEAIKACGATEIKRESHKFPGSSSGVTGVVILAESHISYHTWPEYGFAAIDIFTCGKANPLKAIPIFEKYFNTKGTIKDVMRRGTNVSIQEEKEE